MCLKSNTFFIKTDFRPDVTKSPGMNNTEKTIFIILGIINGPAPTLTSQNLSTLCIISKKAQDPGGYLKDN